MKYKKKEKKYEIMITLVGGERRCDQRENDQ